VFGHVLGPGFFDNLKKHLVHKEVFVPITFDGVRLISTFTMAPTTHL
jgi:hypothetical protein